MRHARSLEKQPGQHDRDRELSNEGIRQSSLIANFILENELNPQLIVTSPAVRAAITAEVVNETLKQKAIPIHVVDELYEASARVFLQVIKTFDVEYNNILCVAHNPGITYLAEYLTKSEIGEMSTASLAIIQLNTDSWEAVGEGTGELIRYVQPQMFSNY